MWPAYFTLITFLIRTARRGTEPRAARQVQLISDLLGDPRPLPPGRSKPLDLPRKSLEVLEDRRNQLLSAGVLRRQGVRKKVEQVARFLGSFMPIRSRSRDQVRFQLGLSEAQGPFVSLHISQQSPQIGRLLSGDPTMLIQVNCLFGHFAGSGPSNLIFRDLAEISAGHPLRPWDMRGHCSIALLRRLKIARNNGHHLDGGAMYSPGGKFRSTPFRSNGWPKTTDLLHVRAIIEATPLRFGVRGNWNSGTSDESPRCCIFHRQLQEKCREGARPEVLRLQIEWPRQPGRSVCTQTADARTCDSGPGTVLRERRNQMLPWD